MTDTDVDLEWLRAFCAVVDNTGFSRAAARLGVQKAAVSKSVQKLEASLGVRLLERSTRAVRPTHAGRVLHEKGRDLLGAVAELSEEVRSLTQRVRGELIVAAPMELGAALARHLVPELRRRHPELKVSLALSYDFADLYAEGIDVAFRIGSAGPTELVSVTVGELRRGLFAAPGYLAARGVPRKPEDLRRHELLGFRIRSEDPIEWILQHAEREVRVPVRGSFSARSFSALLQGAAAGLGITALPADLLGESITAAALSEVLPGWSFPRTEIRAVYPSRRFKPQKLVAFLEVARQLPLFHPGGRERAAPPQGTASRPARTGPRVSPPTSD